MSTDEKLLGFLNDGADWERKPTSLPGVFILKLPAFKGRSATLAIEINPVDSTGFISIANVADLPLNAGNFKINTPGKLVGFLSQSAPSLRNPNSFSSVLIF